MGHFNVVIFGPQRGGTQVNIERITSVRRAMADNYHKALTCALLAFNCAPNAPKVNCQF